MNYYDIARHVSRLNAVIGTEHRPYSASEQHQESQSQAFGQKKKTNDRQDTYQKWNANAQQRENVPARQLQEGCVFPVDFARAFIQIATEQRRYSAGRILNVGWLRLQVVLPLLVTRQGF